MVASAQPLHYASAMRQILMMPLLLLPGLAQAVICKTVDADGVVSYTDVPVEECRTPVKLPDYSRYTPRPIERPASPPPDEPSAASEPAFAGYQSIQFVEPAAEGTVRSNEGKVPVSIALEPPLQAGHLVRLYVDGEAVRGSFSGVDIELSGIERGTHRLRADVVDASGKKLIGSSDVSFTLRQVGLYDGAAGPTPRPPVVRPPGR